MDLPAAKQARAHMVHDSGKSAGRKTSNETLLLHAEPLKTGSCATLLTVIGQAAANYNELHLFYIKRSTHKSEKRSPLLPVCLGLWPSVNQETAQKRTVSDFPEIVRN